MNSNVKLFDNILPKDLNNKIISHLCNNISWNIAREYKKPFDVLMIDKTSLGFSYDSINKNEKQLNHVAKVISDHIFNKIGLIGKLKRVMWNMYYKNQNSFIHIDEDKNNHISIIYNLHNTDGGTKIDNIFYRDKESQAKVFNSNILHQGIGPTDDNVRFNLNMVIETNTKTLDKIKQF